MDVPKLLRTTLFSVFAFVLAAGMAAAPAQAQTIEVNEDDGDTIADGLSTLNSQEDGDGAATLAIVGGDYTDTDANVDVGGLGNISDLTIELRRDDADGVNETTIQSLDINNEQSVTLTSDGDGFLFVQTAGGVNAEGLSGTDLVLDSGTLGLSSGDVLRFQAPADGTDNLNVFRRAGAISGSAPTYNGAISAIQYDARDADIAAGGELTAGNELGTTSPSGATIDRVNTLTVDDQGEGTAQSVVFEVAELNVSTFNHESDDVTFTGDLTVDGSVDNGGALTVEGTLGITAGNSLTASNPINPGAMSASSAGALEFVDTVNRNNTSGALVNANDNITFSSVSASLSASDATGSTNSFISGAGEVAIDELSLSPVDDEGSDSDVIEEEIDVGSSTTYTINDVSVGATEDTGSSTDDTSDETSVNVLNDGSSGSTVNIAGQINNIDNIGTVNLSARPDGSETTLAGLDNVISGSGAGTVNVEGNVTYQFGEEVTNAEMTGGNNGLIDIEGGATLTVDVGESDTQTILTNNGASDRGVTGEGELVVTGASDNATTFKIAGANTNGQNLNVDVTTDVGLVVASNGGGIVAGDLTVNGAGTDSNGLTIGTGGDAGVVIVGAVDANASVTFGGGSGIGEITAGEITADANVTVNGGGPLTTGAITANSGTVDLSNITGTGTETVSSENANVLVAGSVDVNESTGGTDLNITGQSVHVSGDVLRDGSPSASITTGTDPDNTELRFIGTEDSQFDTGSRFEFNGSLVAEKAGATTTLTGAVDFTDDVNIVEPNLGTTNELALNANLFLTGDREGRVLLNGALSTTENTFLIVRGDQKQLRQSAGSTTLPNVRVNSGVNSPSGNELQVRGSSSIQFAGDLVLENGGIDVGSNSDLSPAAESAANVVRFLEGTNTQIAGTGTFNGAENAYDLTYQETGDAQQELAGAVSELTVPAGADVTVDPDNISGSATDQNDFFEVETLTVGGTLASASNNSGDPKTQVRVVGGEHTVTGNLSGMPIRLGGGASLSGSAADDAISTLGDVTVLEEASASISDIKEVDGTFDTAVNASASVALANDSDTDQADNPQAITGQVTLNGSNFELGSFVEAQSGVDANAGTITLGARDLNVSGGSFTASETVTYSADSAPEEQDRGELVLSGANIGTEDDAATDQLPAAIPNVRVEGDGTTGATLDTDVGIARRLVVNAGADNADGVELSSNALTASGDVVLDATTSSNGGTPVAVGGNGTFDVSDASIEIQSGDNDNGNLGDSPDQGVSTLTVSGNSEVAVASTGDDGRTLDVQGTLDIVTDADGSLNVQSNSVRVNGFTVSDDGDGDSDGAAMVASSGGYLAFGDLNGTNGFTTTLARDVNVDQVQVLADTELGPDGQTFTAEDELWLNSQFDASTNDAPSSEQVLALGDGALVRRTEGADGGATNALTETPSFGGEVNLAYSKTLGGDDVTSGQPNLEDSAVFTSGYEVPSASSSATIGDLTVDVGRSTVIAGNTGTDGFLYLERVSQDAATGNVTVTGAVDLESGYLVHGIDKSGNTTGGRLLSLAEDATFAQQNGRIEEAISNTNVPSIDATSYTLQYYPNPTNDVDNNNEVNNTDSDESLTVETSSREFLEGGAVDTLRFVDGPNDAPNDALELHADREVGALAIDRSGASALDLTSGPGNNTRRSLTVTGSSELRAGTVDNGSLAAQGDVSISGGEIDGTLAFAGSSDQGLSLNGDETVGTFSLEQTTPDGEDVPTVTVSGGDLSPSTGSPPTFSNGLLAIEGENALDLGTTDFNRDVADEDASHVIGAVTRTVVDNSSDGQAISNSVAEYPVGTASGSYRPFGFIFTEPPAQQTDITVTHIDENPGETGGLPITGDGGATVGENYPDFYWRTESSNRLSVSGQYEAFAEAEGLPYPDQDAQDFRIIRRPDEGSVWSLVGDGTQYSNTPISESEGRVDIATVGATGDINRAPSRFTVGVPGADAPVANLDVDVNRDFADGASDPTDYELVAIPGSTGVDVAETVTGDRGTNWRAFLEVGGNGGDGSLQSYGDQAFDFEAGRGVWVLAQDGWSFSGEVPAVSSEDGPPSVPLQDGWNAVSNPLQEDLAWTDVQNASGLSGDLFEWTGENGYQSVDTLRSAQENGAAYYTLNSDGAESLVLESSSGSNSTLASASTDEGSGASPRTVELSATTGDAGVTSTVTVGTNPGAKEASSSRAPPTLFGATALRIQDGDPAKSFMRMVTATDSETSQFDLSLQAEPGASVEISADDLPEDVGAEFGVVLVDGNDTYDLRTGPATVKVGEDSKTADFQVRLGNAEKIAQQTAPDETQLESNYPNPFSKQTTIEYTVAEQSEVNIRVYNVLGQQVATLARGTKQAGTYKVDWKGQGLSSGKYFVRLEADGTTDTKQMTVVR